MFATRPLMFLSLRRGTGLCDSNRNRRAFSLTELAVVLGVIGVIISGIWIAASAGRQSAKISQANEDVTEIVTGIRGVYGSQAAIAGSTQTIVPYLGQTGSLPGPVMRTVSTLCVVSANFADTPWGSVSSDPCGTLHICAWNYGVTTVCPVPPATIGSSQVFAVEFAYLDYGTCVALSSAIAPSAPAGMMDVVINGSSSLGANNVISPTSSFATTKCKPALTTNKVDFLYSLRAPSS